VVAAGAELPQQHVQALGLGHEDRGTQHLAHVELLLAGVMAQQVLGEQDADHVVAVLVDDRETRMRRADHLRHEFLHLLVDIDHVHLRARDHDVAHLHFGDGERALGDGQRVGVEQVALVGRAQQLDQVGAVGRLAQDQCG